MNVGDPRTTSPHLEMTFKRSEGLLEFSALGGWRDLSPPPPPITLFKQVAGLGFSFESYQVDHLNAECASATHPTHAPRPASLGPCSAEALSLAVFYCFVGEL